jgi:hypothetical protein
VEFGAEYIRYLILSAEDEIPELVDVIEGMQGTVQNCELARCTADQRKRLMSRVISIAQIKRDF